MDEWPSLKDSPEYQKQLDERVVKIKENEKDYKHLVNVNDVLTVLDVTDEQEDVIRPKLDTLDNEVLKSLTTQTRWEIFNILKNQKSNVNKLEVLEENEKSEQSNQKFSKIKSIFTPELLNQHPKIKIQFEKLDITTDKEAVIKEIINLLKQPWKLTSIINSLGGADLNNEKYVEFKESLIWIDSSFESYFNDLENISSWISLDTNNIVWSIEKDSWWIVDIDLSSNPPVSKMSLIWSEYSFDENIDKQELNNIIWSNVNKLKDIQNSFAILKGVYTPFENLINEIRKNWSKWDIKEVMENAVSNFTNDIFSKLWDMYEDMWIDKSIQINKSDISSFTDVNSPNDLKTKIETIKSKLQKISSHIWKEQAWILKNHKAEIKELLERKSEAKEKQLEVLEFFEACGFGLIPKNISNKIINEIQANVLTIPWLDLNRKNINLKNGHFWESWAFIDKDWWINIEAKRNLVKFMNKMISWNIDEPLSIEGIASWVSRADPLVLKSKFEEIWIVGGMGWNYGRTLNNLKIENK